MMLLSRWALWLVAALPAWLLFGLLGGLAPIWLFLLAAAVLGAVDVAVSGERRWPTPLLAALLPLAPAILAFALPGSGRLAGLALAAAVVAFVVSYLDRLPTAIARRLGLLPIAMAVGVAAVLVGNTLLPRGHGPWVPLPRLLTLHAMVTPVAVPGEAMLVLESGAVAWFDPAARNGSAGSAIFFHGANAEGSAQPTAVIARRALGAAGFAVLAVDHPGYGRSPVPDLDDIAAWDPLPTALAAVDWLAGHAHGGPPLAVGHSMGAGDVLRLLGSDRPLAGAVLMGGGVIDPLDPADADAYWIGRFRSDRGLPAAALDAATIVAIWNAFYDNGRVARGIRADVPPIDIVQFGIEFPDVVAARDRFRSLLPASAVVHDLSGVGHYLDSRRVGGLVLVDARAFAATVAFFAGRPRAAA